MPTKARSYTANAFIASVVLLYVLDLSAPGRTWIDWLVITVVGVALAWNLVGLGMRIHRHRGARGVWHLARTLLFWLVGLLNTLLIDSTDTSTWISWLGWILIGIAILDTLAIAIKEEEDQRAPVADHARAQT